MLAYTLTSTNLFPRMLGALLLLVASLDAHYQKWDHLVCTEPVVSAHKGSRVVMACNISNAFRDVTIQLTAFGKAETIFDQEPPGNISKDSWQLHIQGGQAQLVITDVRDVHAGKYLWKLHGLQRQNKNFILNVTEPPNQKDAEGRKLSLSSNSQDLANQEPKSLPNSAEPPSAVRMNVIITVIAMVMIIGIISAFAWYKHRRSPMCVPRCAADPSGLSPRPPDEEILSLMGDRNPRGTT